MTNHHTLTDAMRHEALPDGTLTDDPLTRGIVPGGTALGDFLYPAPAERRVGAIIGWWERRRLPYNLIVGAVGLAPLTLGLLFTSLVPTLQPVDMIRAVIWWGVLANLCYTLGPAAEIALHKLFGRRLLPAGPLLFRAGVTIAVGVTLLPLIPLVIGFIVRILGLS